MWILIIILGWSNPLMIGGYKSAGECEVAGRYLLDSVPASVAHVSGGGIGELQPRHGEFLYSAAPDNLPLTYYCAPSGSGGAGSG